MGNTPKAAKKEPTKARAEISPSVPDRSLSAAILEAQDNERRRISRELHDSVGQSLVAIKMEIGKLKPRLSGEDCNNALEEINRMVDEAVAEIRTVAHLLYPLSLEALGLRSAVVEYARGFQERTGIQTSVEIPESLPKLARVTETALFRVVQECLTNVHKHAKASNVAILVTATLNEFQLEITDDGIGFPDKFCEGVGLRGMRERVKELGGNLSVWSGAFVGTSTTAAIPLKPNLLSPG
jgi:signal transduction histidine kinase